MPSLLDVDVRATPVSMRVSVTSAPEMTRPVASVTVPTTSVELVCANRQGTHSRTARKLKRKSHVGMIHNLPKCFVLSETQQAITCVKVTESREPFIRLTVL